MADEPRPPQTLRAALDLLDKTPRPAWYASPFRALFHLLAGVLNQLSGDTNAIPDRDNRGQLAGRATDLLGRLYRECVETLSRVGLTGSADRALIFGATDVVIEALREWEGRETEPRPLAAIERETKILSEGHALFGPLATLDATVSNAVPVIWYHGGDVYSRDGLTPRSVSNEELCVLSVFLDSDLSLSKRELESKSGVTNVARVLTRLATAYGGVFADAIDRPGVRGAGGYYVRVRSLRY